MDEPHLACDWGLNPCGMLFWAMSILFVSNEQPTIVGGMLLVKKGALLAKPPIFEWIGEEKSGSQKGSTQRAARSKGRLGRRYRIVDGVTIRGKVEYIADDYTFYSLHQGHHRKVYAIPRRVSAGSADSVSCNVTDRVDWEFRQRLVVRTGPRRGGARVGRS